MLDGTADAAAQVGTLAADRVRLGYSHQSVLGIQALGPTATLGDRGIHGVFEGLEAVEFAVDVAVSVRQMSNEWRFGAPVWSRVVPAARGWDQP